MGGGGGSLGGLSSLFSGGFAGFAGGGIMTGSGPMALRRYAGGGIANSSQTALFGEGSSREAYVPLPDGRTIPVSMKTPSFGAGGASILNVQGGDLHVHGSMDSATLPQLQSMMAEKTRQITDQMQRNIRSMSAKWNQRWGS